MKLHHLSEAVKNPNYEALSILWGGDTFDNIVKGLQKGEENLQMLASILERSRDKHSTSAPENLLSIVNPIINAYDELSATGERWMIEATLSSIRVFMAQLVNTLVAIDSEAATKLFIEKVKVDDLVRVLTSHQREVVKLRLLISKHNRTTAQKKIDKENDLYVFIGRPSFKEWPPGSETFKKALEIEKLVKVDKFDVEAHSMIPQMQLRATFQGENSKVYQVLLPKGAVKGERIPDWLVDVIDQHKTEVR